MDGVIIPVMTIENAVEVYTAGGFMALASAARLYAARPYVDFFSLPEVEQTDTAYAAWGENAAIGEALGPAIAESRLKLLASAWSLSGEAIRTILDAFERGAADKINRASVDFKLFAHGLVDSIPMPTLDEVVQEFYDARIWRWMKLSECRHERRHGTGTSLDTLKSASEAESRMQWLEEVMTRLQIITGTTGESIDITPSRIDDRATWDVHYCEIEYFGLSVAEVLAVFIRFQPDNPADYRIIQVGFEYVESGETWLIRHGLINRE